MQTNTRHKATYPHMAAGWAVAGNTPFMWTKQVPSNYGGTRNGMIVSWPKHIAAIKAEAEAAKKESDVKKALSN